MAARARQWLRHGLIWAVVALGAQAGTLGRHLTRLVLGRGAENARAARDGPSWEVERSGEERLEMFSKEAWAQVVGVDLLVPRTTLEAVRRDL